MTTSSTITVTSRAFQDGGTIPKKYSCDGDDVSPPLSWKGLPVSTGAVALIEHTWAAPLVASVRGAGGRVLDEAWLAPSDVERLRNLTTP